MERSVDVIGIYGGSGFGREVLPTLRAQYAHSGARIVFIDDYAEGEINGTPTYSFDNFQKIPGDKRVTIAIADAAVRRKLVAKCEDAGMGFVEVEAQNVVIGDVVTIGDGRVLCPFVHLTSNVVIGRHFHANIYSYVAHDCRIGDFVTFAPSVKCNGNVHIGNDAYIGTGAILRQGTPERPLMIGEGAVVGMGAVVTKDVPAGVTVIGNPARILEK